MSAERSDEKQRTKNKA